MPGSSSKYGFTVIGVAMAPLWMRSRITEKIRLCTGS
jgi:hypothetical protein